MISSTQNINLYKQFMNTSTVRIKQKVKNFIFDIDEKYEILSLIGQGAYGAVIAARDKTQIQQDGKGKLLAIKKIDKAFEHKLFAKRTLRELKILRLIKGHENIVQINDIQLPRSRQEFNDIYIVQELMETDLHQIIRSQQPLLNEHCQFFLYQILRGLKYIHSAKIIHRDLKPSNLLVNSNCDLKVCDFGLSRCFISDQKYMKYLMYTGYVATRWYRAPELLLSWQEYDSSVDVWSVGCIFAELLRRQPLFPGKDTGSQLKLIIDVLGTPTEEEITNTPLKKFKHYLASLPFQSPKKFEPMFPKATKEALDLLTKMLVFNPKKRITIDECLKHPYLAQLHYPEDEPMLKEVHSEEFEFEYHDLTIEQTKDLIYEEILLYHFNDFKQEYETKIRKGQSVIKHIISIENNAIKENEEENEVDSDENEEFIAQQIRTFLKDKNNFEKIENLQKKK